uniref:Uncharacterized protein n=1 Tax=viral metagenome TaxID=1070528 RepID=A0A6C0KRC3_9ZZZZ
MNFTPLEDAYQIHHINSNTYGGLINYSPICIYCKNNISIALGQHGGAFRQCAKCKKNFRANVISQPVQNFSYSTHHLKGTN